MNEAETLVKKITEGIQEKKGKNIVDNLDKIDIYLLLLIELTVNQIY